MGPPLPCNNVKLVDIPDMEYWASRGQGEVCVMGANVFQGYFRSVSIGIGVAENDPCAYNALGNQSSEIKQNKDIRRAQTFDSKTKMLKQLKIFLIK